MSSAIAWPTVDPAFTPPGFATSVGTKENAPGLMEALRVTQAEVRDAASDVQ